LTRAILHGGTTTSRTVTHLSNEKPHTTQNKYAAHRAVVTVLTFLCSTTAADGCALERAAVLSSLLVLWCVPTLAAITAAAANIGSCALPW
jgi:hypothetical protein